MKKYSTIENTIDSIIHEVNVAHNIDCNPKARYHISKQCYIMRNEAEKKWNELGIWLLNNPNAIMEDIQLVREKLNIGEYVRGFKIERPEKGNDI